MIEHTPSRLWPLLLPVLLLLAACRGNEPAGAVPTLAATAAPIAPAPTARPEVTLTATPVLPFPAPPEGEFGEGDATLPTRTPTPVAASAGAPQPPPVCNGSLTPATVESATYLPNTPERALLFEAGMSGQRLTLTGYVLGPDCAPIPGAWLDFWQADAGGVYDSGFRLRGHQFTDADGRYRLETLVPGPADGRPPVINVRVLAPGGSLLSTQIFFPDRPENAADSLYRPELLLTLIDDQTATFDFVVSRP